MDELVWHERILPHRGPQREIWGLGPIGAAYDSELAAKYIGRDKFGAYFIDHNDNKEAYVWEPLKVETLEEAQAVALALARMGG